MKSFIGIGLYVHDSIKAVEMYREAFGLTLGYHVKNADGTFFHSELDKDGKPMLSVVQTSAPAPENNPVQLGVTFDDKKELLHAFDILKRDGSVPMDLCELPWSPCAAEVIDPFGIRWYLTLRQHRPEENFSPEKSSSLTQSIEDHDDEAGFGYRMQRGGKDLALTGAGAAFATERLPS